MVCQADRINLPDAGAPPRLKDITKPGKSENTEGPDKPGKIDQQKEIFSRPKPQRTPAPIRPRTTRGLVTDISTKQGLTDQVRYALTGVARRHCTDQGKCIPDFSADSHRKNNPFHWNLSISKIRAVRAARSELQDQSWLARALTLEEEVSDPQRVKPFCSPPD